MRNIGDVLRISATQAPNHTAIVYHGQRICYDELNARVNRLSHHLLELGVQKGDRVGFMFYNSNQFIEIFFATVKIGAVAVPLNYRLIPREVKWCLDNTHCKVFAYSEACSKQVDPVNKEFLTVKHLIYSGSKAPCGEHHFETFTQNGTIEEPRVEISFEDRAVIIFTGGTTGVPKGATHTHYSLIFAYLSTMISSEIKSLIMKETLLLQVPMFHVAGMNVTGTFLASGGCLVIVDTLDPEEILRLIQKEQITRILLVPPSTYIRLLDYPHLKDFDTTSVTHLLTGISAFSKPLMSRLFEAFPNGSFIFGYGFSENCSLGAGLYLTRSMYEKNLEMNKSIGRESVFCLMRLVDDEGKDVPVGEVGEAIVQSPYTMKEYYGQPELTAQTIKDKWVYSGDYLKKDHDGFYYFVDRKKDMIKTGGENVFAPEVERTIMSHPSVEMCAIFAVPDPKLHEAVMAVIKLRKGFKVNEEEIVEFCKKNLSSYKKPRRVEFVDTFPMSDAGKIQKFKLREQYSTTETE